MTNNITDLQLLLLSIAQKRYGFNAPKLFSFSKASTESLESGRHIRANDLLEDTKKIWAKNFDPEMTRLILEAAGASENEITSTLSERKLP